MSWIHTKAFFSEYSNKDGLTEEQKDILGISTELELVKEDFSFHTNRVIAYNRSETPEYTTVWLEGNSPITITVDYDELKEILDNEY